MKQSGTGSGYELIVSKDRDLIKITRPCLVMSWGGTCQITIPNLKPPETTLDTGEAVMSTAPETWVRAGKNTTVGILQMTDSMLYPCKVIAVHKPWGAEFRIEPPPYFGLFKYITVQEDARTSLQSHAEKTETIIGVDGKEPGHITVEGEQMSIFAEPVTITPGQVHRVTGPLEYFEASTFHPEDVIRHEDDYGR